MLNLPDFFEYRANQLFIEDCEVSKLAQDFGTPLYIYSQRAIYSALQRYQTAFADVGLETLVCYAVKANSNVNLLRKLGEWGAGADVVSGGELYRARTAGIGPERIVFAGVGKTQAEIDYALSEGVLAFNVESADEVAMIESRARYSGKSAVGVSLRVRPDVTVDTHHYITTGATDSKFGMPIAQVLELAGQIAQSPHLKLRGLHAHIGSQLLDVSALLEAAQRVLNLALKIETNYNLTLEYLDLGGGLGVDYAGTLPAWATDGPKALASGLAQLLRQNGRHYRLVVEPGRYLVAMAGVLVARTLYLKGDFAIVDAGMNDLLRPALYQAVHPILPLTQAQNATKYNIVGPVCESADFLGHAIPLPVLQPNDMLAIMGAGAYGFSMASNYNSRPRPPEILVMGDQARLIRRRETYTDLLATEMA